MPKAYTYLIAEFPPGSFLENITSCPGGGFLVTCLNTNQIFWIPPYRGEQVVPFLLETFKPDQSPMGIVNAPNNPNVFYFLTCDFASQGSKTAHLHTIDLGNPSTGWRSKSIMQFPPGASGLNGLCALSDSVLLAADSFASCIWRIDLDTSSNPPPAATAKVWTHGPMFSGTLILPDFQPGANGLKYSKKTGCVYFTNTQQELFCAQRVDPETHDAVGKPEIIATGGHGDDLILDEDHPDGPMAYVTTHRDNTILKIPLTLGDVEAANKATEIVVQGSVEEHDFCLGPTSGTWEIGSEGKIAYFAFDGGLKGRPSDGIAKCGTVVRVELQED